MLDLSDENVLCTTVAVGLKSGTEAHASCCNSIAYLVSLSHKQASVSVGSWAAMPLPLLSHFKGFTGSFLHLFYGHGSDSFQYGFTQLILFKKGFYHSVLSLRTRGVIESF